MNIAINDKMYARQISLTTYAVVEDRQELMHIGQHTFSFDCVAMLDLYQRYYEVSKCLRKTSVRSTYIMLHEEKVRLEAEIERRINAHN